MAGGNAAERESVFTQRGGEQYQNFSESGGYAVSMRAIGKRIIAHLQKLKRPALLVEVGGGQARSDRALRELLEMSGITNTRRIVTEPDGRLIRAASSDAPRVQSPAETLPFKTGSADVVWGSQVIHWIKSLADLTRHVAEARRVLKDGGLFVHATSGVTDLGPEWNERHFTRSPFVQVYLAALGRQLEKRGYWQPGSDGPFEPTNPEVNPRYHQFSLDDYRTVFTQQGFSDVEVDVHMFVCDGAEITARLTNLASIQMHFFQSERLRAIPDEEKVVMAKAAFDQAMEEAPDLFSLFDQQDNPHGEPVPIISAVS